MLSVRHRAKPDIQHKKTAPEGAVYELNVSKYNSVCYLHIVNVIRCHYLAFPAQACFNLVG